MGLLRDDLAKTLEDLTAVLGDIKALADLLVVEIGTVRDAQERTNSTLVELADRVDANTRGIDELAVGYNGGAE